MAAAAATVTAATEWEERRYKSLNLIMIFTKDFHSSGE
jgi:hypothetical protein